MTITQRSHTANNYNPLQQIDVKLFPDPFPIWIGQVSACMARETDKHE